MFYDIVLTWNFVFDRCCIVAVTVAVAVQTAIVINIIMYESKRSRKSIDSLDLTIKAGFHYTRLPCARKIFSHVQQNGISWLTVWLLIPTNQSRPMICMHVHACVIKMMERRNASSCDRVTWLRIYIFVLHETEILLETVVPPDVWF